MKRNVGKTDRSIRVMLSLAIFIAGIYFQSWWGLVGFIPLLTGLGRSCPIYSVIGVSTDKKAETVR